jgi:hypothetical protein
VLNFAVKQLHQGLGVTQFPPSIVENGIKVFIPQLSLQLGRVTAIAMDLSNTTHRGRVITPIE